jgi:hypothetical protein
VELQGLYAGGLACRGPGTGSTALLLGTSPLLGFQRRKRGSYCSDLTLGLSRVSGWVNFTKFVGLGGRYFLLFYGCFGGGFEKVCFFDGNSMVKLWWNAWFLWWENASYFTAQNLPLF